MRASRSRSVFVYLLPNGPLVFLPDSGSFLSPSIVVFVVDLPLDPLNCQLRCWTSSRPAHPPSSSFSSVSVIVVATFAAVQRPCLLTAQCSTLIFLGLPFLFCPYCLSPSADLSLTSDSGNLIHTLQPPLPPLGESTSTIQPRVVPS